ncbi:hypothetical protein F0562_019578 [Nyssa sinensis]|uniref:Uncharacterized protein n=1 Tax=Nyssa sinensis TaxID=561372 RepID=A0A5J5BPG5_9ASTE|nr:hypothetical protein F0562_019578 [Nyssa sinensis]
MGMLHPSQKMCFGRKHRIFGILKDFVLEGSEMFAPCDAAVEENIVYDFLVSSLAKYATHPKTSKVEDAKSGHKSSFIALCIFLMPSEDGLNVKIFPYDVKLARGHVFGVIVLSFGCH